MASENAKAVALEVSESIRKRKKIILGKIIRENGYSIQTSLKPKLVTATKTYQKIMQPIVEKLEIERQRAIDELSLKDLTKERYSDLVKGVDIITKNIQLLGGKPTEINKIDLSDLSNEELVKLTEESDEGISEEGISEEKL